MATLHLTGIQLPHAKATPAKKEFPRLLNSFPHTLGTYWSTRWPLTEDRLIESILSTYYVTYYKIKHVLQMTSYNPQTCWHLVNILPKSVSCSRLQISDIARQTISLRLSSVCVCVCCFHKFCLLNIPIYVTRCRIGCGCKSGCTRLAGKASIHCHHHLKFQKWCENLFNVSFSTVCVRKEDRSDYSSHTNTTQYFNFNVI
jgi:hypothetical protein